MHAELHQRLKTLDSDGAWEMPDDFDWSRALKEVVRHQPQIERLTGLPLTLDDQVQDASFFCELHHSARNPLPGGGVEKVPLLAIRFSTFDRMFTIYGRNVEESECPPGVIDYLTKQGYKYVALADLRTPYDGKATRGTGGWTWFTRFFDFL